MGIEKTTLEDFDAKSGSKLKILSIVATAKENGHNISDVLSEIATTHSDENGDMKDLGYLIGFGKKAFSNEK